MSNTADLVREFDRQTNAKRDARNRAAASAHRRESIARTSSSVLRLAVGAAAVGLLVAVVVVL